jgi:hypothetical protein
MAFSQWQQSDAVALQWRICEDTGIVQKVKYANWQVCKCLAA